MVSVVDSYVGERGFEPPSCRYFCRFCYFFYSWVVLNIQISFLIVVSNLREICVQSYYPRNYLQVKLLANVSSNKHLQELKFITFEYNFTLLIQ